MQPSEPHLRKVTLQTVTLRRGENLVSTGESSPSTKWGHIFYAQSRSKSKGNRSLRRCTITLCVTNTKSTYYCSDKFYL